MKISDGAKVGTDRSVHQPRDLGHVCEIVGPWDREVSPDFRALFRRVK